MNPLDYIPKSLLGVIVLALLTTNISCAFKNGELQLEVSRKATQLAEMALEHSEAVLDAQSKQTLLAQEYRAKEQSLQIALDTQRKKSNETIATYAAQRDALKLQLSEGTRVASYSPGLSAARAATYLTEAPIRSDLTFLSREVDQLIDEAFRADEIRIELLGCYAAYDEAKKAMK